MVEVNRWRRHLLDFPGQSWSTVTRKAENNSRGSEKPGWSIAVQRKPDDSAGTLAGTHSVPVWEVTSRWSQGLHWCEGHQETMLWACSCGNIPPNVPRYMFITDQLDNWSQNKTQHSETRKRSPLPPVVFLLCPLLYCRAVPEGWAWSEAINW